ncbi:OPT family oligopeptide transporter [Helicocarpus griseus UAMH5409]|uniref:OPT family oligopeptide transporter n=1 Tax=Helicocarpus griseus UAMH5409 TaxID=1447875 RepID=A0A2B7Y187_9EURO|nr:OPT family oligopeptide transporter [Helicocarpus griseus UAMH5409]
MRHTSAPTQRYSALPGDPSGTELQEISGRAVPIGEEEDDDDVQSAEEDALDGETIVSEGDAPGDPFLPFQDMHYDSNPILTFRALLVGCLCGALVNASNIYLGLKAGWTTSANIFGSIVGFAVLRAWTKYTHDDSFGPHENNIVQTAATAAGGLSNVFVSAIPALYQLELLSVPATDFFRIVTLTAIGGYFGLLSVAPLRNFFLVQVARELNLIFPSSSATAITIRSMHQAASGASMARQKLAALLYAFIFAVFLRVTSQYAIGILWDWHPFTWLVSSGILVDWAMSMESWGWFIELTPAFIGSGMLVGINVAVSFTAGSVMAWGIIGPYLVSHGMAFGEPASTDSKWSKLMSYSSLSKDFATASHPSPRYWLLWPGVICMAAVALAELACQWRVFWIIARDSTRAIICKIASLRQRNHRYTPLNVEKDESDSSSSNTIKVWMWLPGLIAIISIACPILKFQFGMRVTESLLALLLAFVLSLMAIQATGATDTTPLSVLSKVSQVTLSSTTQDQTIQNSQRLNLLGGALTNIGASQACDLMGDFRVGYLLGTSPRLQYATQLIGTLFATFFAPSIFLMFATAYPCILSTENNPSNDNNNTTTAIANTCEFASPSIAAWRAVAVAATEPILPVPRSSLIFSLIMSVIGVLMVIIRHNVWVGKWELMRAYHPNIMILAMAFTLPAPQYGIAMLIGALIAAAWKWKAPVGFEAFGYAVAAGFMAGEGIGGTINAMLSVVGFGGERLGTRVGCPAGRC